MDGGTRASELLSVSVVPRPVGRVRRWMRWAGVGLYLVVVAAAPFIVGPADGGTPGALSRYDVVVRRRDTDEELLRTGADSPDEAEGIRAHMETQLAELSVEEFCDRWGIPWGAPAASV